jgi:hypothetical protein
MGLVKRARRASSIGAWVVFVSGVKLKPPIGTPTRIGFEVELLSAHRPIAELQGQLSRSVGT